MSKQKPVKTSRASVKGAAVRRVTTEAERIVELPEGMRDRIARKAYELWEERGRRDGHHMEDWHDAEAIVMEEIHEARE